MSDVVLDVSIDGGTAPVVLVFNVDGGVVAPKTNVVTLADAKAWIGITGDDKNQILADLVDAGTEACFQYMGRNPLLGTFTDKMSAPGGSALALNRYPIQMITSVTINPDQGGSPLPPTAYTWDDNAVYYRLGTFPRGIKNVSVSGTAGLPFTPALLVVAVKMTIKAMWDGRLTDMNSTGESWSDVGGSTFWPSGPGSVPQSARSNLQAWVSVVKV